MEPWDLLVMALAASMTVPVVGALLMFALQIGPAAAARSFVKQTEPAIALAVAIALVTVWTGIAASHHANRPLRLLGRHHRCVFFLAGSGCAAVRRRRLARQPAAALARALRTSQFRNEPSSPLPPPTAPERRQAGRR